MTTFTLQRYGKGPPVTFRNPVDVEEMDRWCREHSHIEVRSNSGDARQVKVNGQVTRWKRDRNRIAVPVKYGLRECTTLTANDIGRVLIPVEDGE